MKHPLCRQDVYNCCWVSPAQSFSGPTPASLRDHTLLSQIRDFPNLEGQVPVFISPRNRVAQLYPQALGSLFVASYDSQDYGGSIGNIVIQSVPHRKHHVSTTKPNRVMLFRETVAVYCENHTEHTDYTLWTECKVLVC
jgi:hypothetical protein